MNYVEAHRNSTISVLEAAHHTIVYPDFLVYIRQPGVLKQQFEISPGGMPYMPQYTLVTKKQL